MYKAASSGQPPDPRRVSDYFATKRLTPCDALQHIVVDGFRYTTHDPWRVTHAHCGCSTLYFLSHFHSDHYIGLYDTWRYGTIYTTKPTMALVVNELGVDAAYLREVPLNEPMAVSSPSPLCPHRHHDPSHHTTTCVEVVALDANHCPGAAIFLFFVFRAVPSDVATRPGTLLSRVADGSLTAVSPTECVVHTGDFRFDERFFMGNKWVKLAVETCGISTLYLDNTFCDPRYDFPPQAGAIAMAVNAVRTAVEELEAESAAMVSAADGGSQDVRQKQLAVVSGSYSIGKERIVRALHHEFHQPVYVTREKHKLLAQLDLPYMRIFKCDHGNYNHKRRRVPTQRGSGAQPSTGEGGTVRVIFVLSGLGGMSYTAAAEASMAGELCVSEGEDFRIPLEQYDRVLLLSPTGWNNTRSASKRTTKVGDKICIIALPYSEHSSWSELLQCVQCMRPTTVIPTVSEATYLKHEAVFCSRCPHLRATRQNSIARFAQQGTLLVHQQATTAAPQTSKEENTKTGIVPRDDKPCERGLHEISINSAQMVESRTAKRFRDADQRIPPQPQDVELVQATASGRTKPPVVTTVTLSDSDSDDVEFVGVTKSCSVIELD